MVGRRDCGPSRWQARAAHRLSRQASVLRLADEKRETILVACSKCDWRAAFARDDLIASHGADYAMPNLLNHLAAPECPRLGSTWDRCGGALRRADRGQLGRAKCNGINDSCKFSVA